MCVCDTCQPPAGWTAELFVGLDESVGRPTMHADSPNPLGLSFEFSDGFRL